MTWATTTAPGEEGDEDLWGPAGATPRSEVLPDVIYEQVSRGVPCWISDSTGIRSTLHINRWLGGVTSTPEDRLADARMLDCCSGPTLDIGCGPGRLVAALNDRDVPATGIDTSALAVEMTRRRGGAAIHGDVFGPLPGCEGASHILLADGNIGIGGDPLRMLVRASELLAPEGNMIIELDPTTEGVHQLTRRWETVLNFGPWFSWARVGVSTFDEIAHQAGLVLVDEVHVAHRSFVVTEQSRRI